MEQVGHKPDVIVLGAGIVGLSCALELARAGVRVRVLDKGEPGGGCSFGNAGWVTPCFALPLPQPGLFWKSFGWLLNPDSPLHIKPQPSVLLARWLFAFLRAMRVEQFRRSTQVMIELSRYTLKEYEELNARTQGALGLQRRGLLMAAQSRKGLGAACAEMKLVSEFGVRGEQLSAEAARQREPALVGHLDGAVIFPDEGHLEPHLAVQALVREAQALGVVIESGCEVYAWETGQGKITSVQTTAGARSADAYVLATGSWSTELSRELALRVPILGGKGYSLIVPPLQPSPQIPLMLLEKKIAVTPRDGSLRIAGTLELVNQDFSITKRRVRAIEKGAREFLNLPKSLQVRQLWRGLRPCTPDGVPMIGSAPNFSNLFLCCGHQMLGLQSAVGSGRLLADLLLHRPPVVDPRPFRVERF